MWRLTRAQACPKQACRSYCIFGMQWSKLMQWQTWIRSSTCCQHVDLHLIGTIMGFHTVKLWQKKPFIVAIKWISSSGLALLQVWEIWKQTTHLGDAKNWAHISCLCKRKK
jgi:hypothetical protein